MATLTFQFCGKLRRVLRRLRRAGDALSGNNHRASIMKVELPEDGLEKLLSKLKDTRVAGKQLKLRRYRED